MKIFVASICLFISVSSAQCGVYAQQGCYFSKQGYEAGPLPTFAEVRNQLPEPIYEENPLWVETYWRAWEIASGNFYEPSAGNGFVSQYIDAAFNRCIFMWDTSFMTMFSNYGHGLVPGIASLDNFYVKQYPDGEICREIDRDDGSDCSLWVNSDAEPMFSRWGYDVDREHKKSFVNYSGRPQPTILPHHTLDNMNHPIMAWAELESFRMTGDTARLAMVYEPLRRQYGAFREYLMQGNGLYITDWASMDNSSRNKYLVGGGVGIDISCEMAMFARNLSDIASTIGRNCDVSEYKADAAELSAKINDLMWSEKDGFYYDLTNDGRQVGIKTVAAYWALLGDVADDSRTEMLITHLRDSAAFGRRNMVPTLAASEEGFSSTGDYWCGAVWAPTTTMVVEGLLRSGYSGLARDIALNHVALVADVYKNTGTIWENYAPDKCEHGRHPDGRAVAGNFVGWSGIGPVKFFLEYAVGLRANAPLNRIVWTISTDQAVGCRHFRFGSNVVSLFADMSQEAGVIEVDAAGPFSLEVIYAGNRYLLPVDEGHHVLSLAADTMAK